MDIRTKLIFALVAVALSSMFVFGAVVAPDVEQRLRESTLEQLDELAESKLEALEWVVEGWRDRTALISSRTQLRLSLAEYERTGDLAQVTRVRTILQDALASTESVEALVVADHTGQVVASVARDPEAAVPARSSALVLARDVAYQGVDFDGDGAPRVTFSAPLAVDGTLVGSVSVVFDATELVELTGHYHGLGDTGEVLLVVSDSAGTVRTLHPTRHQGAPLAGAELGAGTESTVARALAGETEPVWEGVEDYRGEAVWTATRYVAETGWGLVVKIDHEEQIQPYAEFEDSLGNTALVLSAFAILAGFVLGLRFALPIQSLVEVANRIRRGDMTARAEVLKEDEIGMLARTFNDMASEIEGQMALLKDYQQFFDVSIDLMCMAGTDGFFKRVNPAFEHELGWAREELLERPFFDFVHPDDIDSTQAEVAKLAQGIPTISFENRYRCKDGGYKRLRWTSYPDLDTGVLYAIAHVMDSPESR